MGLYLRNTRKKASAGIEVRVMYDKIASASKLPKKYPKILEEKGIKCIPYHDTSSILGPITSHLDHRKIIIIDGQIAFTGGINIADECINIYSKYGHWKDNGLRIKGEAVWNFTVLFLNMWNSYQLPEEDNFTKYRNKNQSLKEEDGYVVPYGDTPLDNDTTGEDIYLNIINQANKYVYIFTPYLIINNNIMKSFKLAVKRGVDVRIIIPGIPDKKIVYTLSEAYAEQMIQSGIKIYKYNPGFIHSKVFISDDHIATVGTINLDYRSLYFHFKCGVYLENITCIQNIKKDLMNTIDKSHQVTVKEIQPKFIKSIFQTILKLFAPLM